MRPAKSLAIDQEAPPTFSHIVVPSGVGHREGSITESLVGGRLSSGTQNQFPGFHLDPVLLFCSEQDLKKLLTVIPGRLVYKKDSLEETEQTTRVFRKRGGLEFPVLEVISSKGPKVKELVPKCVRGTCNS